MNPILIVGMVGLAAWLWSLRDTQAGANQVTSGTVASPSKGPIVINIPTASPATTYAAGSDPSNTFPQWGKSKQRSQYQKQPSPIASDQAQPMPANYGRPNPQGSGCGKNCDACNGPSIGNYPDGAGACMQPTGKSLSKWLSKNFPGFAQHQQDNLQSLGNRMIAGGVTHLSVPFVTGSIVSVQQTLANIAANAFDIQSINNGAAIASFNGVSANPDPETLGEVTELGGDGLDVSSGQLSNEQLNLISNYVGTGVTNTATLAALAAAGQSGLQPAGNPYQ